MGFQETEVKVAGIENLMPQRELEEEGVKYTLHLEEKVKAQRHIKEMERKIKLFLQNG